MDQFETSWYRKLTANIKKYKALYIMAVPVLAYYVIFHYLPMYGVIMSFQDFRPATGFFGSEWVGLENFKKVFSGIYFYRAFRNTVVLSVLQLLFGFPSPIILALLLNEVKVRVFKRTVQTITYLPHFISLVVICSIIIDFTSSRGLINELITQLGGEKIVFMSRPEWFRPIFITTNIWQYIGWNSIIYLAALANVNPELYEAARIDGAGRWKQTVHVTIPCILPTIIILLIIRIGNIMNVGYEKILLLYTPLTYETADVITTYVYRAGLINKNYGFAAAAGLFNSVINFVMLISANRLSRITQQTSLW